MNTTAESNRNVFLSLQHIEKVYPNGEKSVYDFNLDIYKNEFIVIVGPSGCGKSTTLRMIAGLEDITAGNLYLEDELINYKPCKDRKMAIVFQSYALYPQMTVYDNIAFPLTINKYSMPVYNTELMAVAQARRVLAEVDFKTLIEVLADALQMKCKEKERVEKIAMLFGILPEAAKRLLSLYAPYDSKESSTGAAFGEGHDDVIAKKGELLAEWNAELSGEIVEKKRALEADGIKVNDDFYVVDENGNVKYELRKYTPLEIKERVFETAEKLNLRSYLDKLPKELSGGQMQRVALGRAIIKNVPIFMMDEPLSNLDAKLRMTMRSEIVKLHNRINATTIYVTHDQTEAMTMATRIVVMSRGFIQQIGTPKEVYNQPVNLFVAKFIGSPAMNVFEAEYDPEAGTLVTDEMVLSVGRAFAKTYDRYYTEKVAEFERLCTGNFGKEEKEKVLRIISGLGEYDTRKKKVAKKSLFAALKRKFSPAPETDENAYEKRVALDMLDALRLCKNGKHKLLLGIRPERFTIQKEDEAPSRSGYSFTVTPTVCELLGGEYGIHFDFCGKDMVGQIDAKQEVSVGEKLTVSFSVKDLYIFDPVTGDVIK